MKVNNRVVKIHQLNGDIKYYVEQQYNKDGAWYRLSWPYDTRDQAIESIQKLNELERTGEVVYIDKKE